MGFSKIKLPIQHLGLAIVEGKDKRSSIPNENSIVIHAANLDDADSLISGEFPFTTQSFTPIKYKLQAWKKYTI